MSQFKEKVAVNVLIGDKLKGIMAGNLRQKKARSLA